jgi:hypothetical protein
MDLGIEVEMALRQARAAMEFQQLPLADHIADRYRLEPPGLRLAWAPGLALL